MSRRVGIALVCLLVLALVIEIGVRRLHNTRSSVEIVNEGDTLLENLVVTFGGSRIAMGAIGAGEKSRVWLSGGDKGTLSLSFTQARNPMSGFLIPEFDPVGMQRDGLRMVIHVKPNQVLKYMDDEENSSPLGRLRDWIGDPARFGSYITQ
jgi:hypothetical protein